MAWRERVQPQRWRLLLLALAALLSAVGLWVRPELGVPPSLLAVALLSYQFGRSAWQSVERFTLSPTYLLYQLAPPSLAPGLFARLLALWLQILALPTMVGLPYLAALGARGKIDLWGLLVLLQLSLVGTLLGWAVGAIYLLLVGEEGALFLSRGTYYLAILIIPLLFLAVPWVLTALLTFGPWQLAFLLGVPLVTLLVATSLTARQLRAAAVAVRSRGRTRGWAKVGPAFRRLQKEIRYAWRHPRLRAALLVAPPIFGALSVILFIASPLAQGVAASQFYTSLMATSFVSVMVQEERGRESLLQLAPVGLAAISRTKALVSLLPALPVWLFGGWLMARAVGPTGLLIGLPWGLLWALGSSYVTAQEQLKSLITGSARRERSIGTMLFLLQVGCSIATYQLLRLF